MLAEDELIYYKLGVGLLRSGRLESARRALETYVERRSEDSAALHNLGVCCARLGDNEAAVDYFKSSWALDPTRVEAAIDGAACWIKLGQPDRASSLCLEALRLPDCPATAMHNLNTALRMAGKLDEAVHLSWARVCAACPSLSEPSERMFSDATGNEGSGGVEILSPALVIACVKWGCKYGPEYVNRLKRGIAENLERDHTFLCLTDDADGLDDEIQCLPFVEEAREWKGWWCKACLFDPQLAQSLPEGARMFYIDLDTVITGSLDEIVGFQGRFGALSPDGMANERRQEGINSSVLAWSAGDPVCCTIFSYLTLAINAVQSCTYKFDHWLEMVVLPHMTALQEVYPGQVLEYASIAAGEPAKCESNSKESLAKLQPPPHARLVTFPLSPKPHECGGWVQHYWEGQKGTS
jgi:hypothetical protein